MRLVLQRVKSADVTMNGGEMRRSGEGLAVLAGMCASDNEAVCRFMAEKMANLRIFDDGAGHMNRSLLDEGGACMLVSNFTLYARCRKGRRPSFTDAAPPEQANCLYERLVREVRALGIQTQTGEFGADMEINLCCDGPVTILLDSDELMPGRVGLRGTNKED